MRGYGKWNSVTLLGKETWLAESKWLRTLSYLTARPSHRARDLGETAVDCTLSICLTFDLSAAGLADFQVLSDAAIVPHCLRYIAHWSPCRHAPPPSPSLPPYI